MAKATSWSKGEQVQAVTSLIDALVLLVVRLKNDEVRLLGAEMSHSSTLFLIVGDVLTLKVETSWVAIPKEEQT